MSDPVAYNRPMHPRPAQLLLIVIVPALLIAAGFYLLRPDPVAPAPNSLGRRGISDWRALIEPAKLGAYGTFEQQGSPAWELRRDPALAARLGYGREDVLLLRCECGRIIRILEHHVATDGMVRPSIWHDVPECGWHVMGQLTGWDNGEWTGKN
jgi:hypothetical protein